MSVPVSIYVFVRIGFKAKSRSTECIAVESIDICVSLGGGLDEG